MKAIAINAFGGREKLELTDRPQPVPAAGELLIRVKGAGVNPVDWKIREGYLQGAFPHEFPIILGWEAAGVVEGKGEGATRFAPGQAVYTYARKPVIKDGAYAEFLAVPETQVAEKPARLSFEEASAIPLAGLTAYQSLFNAAALKAGEVLLIQGAAGGVGSFAVQFAKYAGAVVLGTASSKNHDYVRELGVEYAIDYTQRDFRDAVRDTFADGVDVVFDCVGAEALLHSADVLKPDGRLVTITDHDKVETLQSKGVNAQYVFVEPDGEQLQQLAAMADKGNLKVHLSAVLPLEEAARAHEMSEGGHVRGKIVLTP